MALAAGAKLGPYEILAAIGKGGMGEVWKARDTRLDRIVAIKFCVAEFSERFGREAKAIAALNHSNICQIYDVGPDYIVMEYVEGAPVAPVDAPRKLLDIAVQMSDGLAAAHAAGIVHRDLKPDNVLITRDGRVKILDFGLAKAAHSEIDADDATRTIDPGERALTDPGTTVGTVAYMSPEQARGQTNLTAQSDQFSLGLVLYELAAGKRAFRRGTKAETMTAIIREDAEPLPATVPVPLRWVIERLLHKEPAERYDSTGDLYRELRQLRDHLSESVSASAIPAVAGTSARTGSTTGRRAILGVGLAAALACSAGLAALLIRPAPADLSSYKFTPIARDEATERFPAWSPDGRSIAYTAGIQGVDQVFTKAIDSPERSQLTRAADACYTPLWSPDGSTIYYTSHGDLWSVGASGGTAELVMEKVAPVAQARGSAVVTLHPNGKTVVFQRDGKAWAGTLKGDPPQELARVPRGNVSAFVFSPDGSQLAAIVNQDLWILPYPSGTPRDLHDATTSVSWFPDNRYLLIAGGNFNNTLTILDSTNGSSRVIYRGTDTFQAAVSPDGKKIAYSGGAAEWDILEVSLPEGRVRTLVGGGGVSWQPDWAPSGTHYLYATFVTGAVPGIEDRYATEGFSRRVANAPPGTNTYAEGPRWSPDGTRFLFSQGPVGRQQLTIANASGGNWTPIADSVVQHPHVWSPDGQWVAFIRNAAGKQQLEKVKPVAGATPVVLAKAIPVATSYSTIDWSPTGEWILYPSAEGISMISPDGNVVRKLTALNFQSYAFSKDGKQVYGIYRNTTGQGPQWQLHLIGIKGDTDKMIAALDFPVSTGTAIGFSIHPDGKRFLTSIAKWPYDIWMFEGFDQPKPMTWLGRLLGR
jgi:Tol biopolymer transport system component/predicted Ser/Thr protein kinase